jgi:hypothetical protein
VRKSTGVWRPRAPERGEHRPAVATGHQHIQHDQVIGLGQREVEAVVSTHGDIHHVAAFGEAFVKIVGCLALVFDDENSHRTHR